MKTCTDWYAVAIFIEATPYQSFFCHSHVDRHRSVCTCFQLVICTCIIFHILLCINCNIYAKKMLRDLSLIREEAIAENAAEKEHTFRKGYNSFIEHRFGPNASKKRRKRRYHTQHSTRHTFSRLCESYEVREADRKRLLGHSLKGDVTNDVYGHRSVEELSREVEKIQTENRPQ